MLLGLGRKRCLELEAARSPGTCAKPGRRNGRATKAGWRERAALDRSLLDPGTEGSAAFCLRQKLAKKALRAVMREKPGSWAAGNSGLGRKPA